MFLAIFHIKKDGVSQTIVDIGGLMGKVNWVIVILLGCVAPISSLVESDEAGIFQAIVEKLTPLGAKVGPVASVFLMAPLDWPDCFGAIKNGLIAKLALF